MMKNCCFFAVRQAMGFRGGSEEEGGGSLAPKHRESLPLCLTERVW